MYKKIDVKNNVLKMGEHYFPASGNKGSCKGGCKQHMGGSEQRGLDGESGRQHEDFRD